MIQWLKRLIIRSRDRFRIPQSGISLPECRIRPMRADDIGQCEAIYRLNEPGRFPDGYLDHFSKWLRDGSSLVLVAEVAGQIRGLGGMNKVQLPEIQFARFAFGMVHPDFHRKGFGTALLVARLSILPVPDPEWFVTITTVGGSHTFYKRFGFIYDLISDFDSGTKLDSYHTRVVKPEWDACRARLQRAKVVTADLSDAYIPTSSNPS